MTKIKTRRDLSNLIKLHAPRIAALEKHQDAVGPFAEHLEREGLLKVVSRNFMGYPRTLEFDASNWDWSFHENIWLQITGNTAKAERYLDGRESLKVLAAAYAIRALKLSPLFIIIYYLTRP